MTPTIGDKASISNTRSSAYTKRGRLGGAYVKHELLQSSTARTKNTFKETYGKKKMGMCHFCSLPRHIMCHCHELV